MSAFDELAAAGNLLGIAMQTPNLTLTVCEVLNEDSGGDVEVAARSMELLEQWTAAAPESRAAVLMSFAWRSRETEVPEGGSPAQMYAHDLNLYARVHDGDSESFHGRTFPAMPLPGQAGALASSVAFDREDCEVSLKTALLLLAAKPPAEG